MKTTNPPRIPVYAGCDVIAGGKSEFAAALGRFNAQSVDECVLSNSETEFSPFRTTIAKPVSVSGIGTFRGSEKRTITFAPSQKPGWWIRRTDLPEQLDTEVSIANLWTSARNLVLRSGSPHNYLRMTEHIIALKAGLGLDDVVICTNSGDPPLFDESSQPLVKAVESAGIVEKKDSPAAWCTVEKPGAFAGSRGDFIMFLPAENGEKRLRADVAIDFNSVIGKQRVLFDVTPDVFRRASLARTNATHRQYLIAKTIGRLFADMRNLGYNKNNILIHGSRKYYGEPRFPSGNGKFLEPVWHRATLDFLAAVSLLAPARFAGTVVSFRGGHTQDCDLVRAIVRNNLLRPL